MGRAIVLFLVIAFVIDYSLLSVVQYEEVIDYDYVENISDLTSSNLTLAKSIELTQFPGETCNRPCIKDEEPRTCYFKFVLEQYHAMGPACGECVKGVVEDCYHPHCVTGVGIERSVMSINRKIPGPQIHVCKNDLIVVDVANHMAGTASTIHWHGPHQRKTPHMDGVPFVTQCPIEYSTTFRYSFLASEPGTQFYHSHSGYHKVNGHYGALIIREPPGIDPNYEHYDSDLPEHVILISDWMNTVAETFVPGNPSSGGILPNSLLINGFGQTIHPETNEKTKVPLEKYHVEPNKRYRFRFINSVSHVCNTQLQIENHKMIIIASDSYNVHPKEIDTLISMPGERFDFIIETNQSIRNYWIRARLIGPCSRRKIEQFAILAYAGTSPEIEILPEFYPPKYDDEYPSGITLNHPNTTCFLPDDNKYCIADLESHVQDDKLRTAEPDVRFTLAFDNYIVPNSEIFQEGRYNHFTNIQRNITVMGAINKLSFVMPPFPLLTQWREIDENMFCEENHRPSECNDRRICPCIHRIKIELNKIVELIILDETKQIGVLNHPFHLHGYRIMVTHIGQSPDGYPMTRTKAQLMENFRRSARMESENKLPPFKDTVSVPSRGYTVVRFRATNPGFWLLHCHYEWHMAVGMGMVLQVGEIKQMQKIPKHFPTCGNYLPAITKSSLKP